jgi:hypothetical protein
MNISDILPKLKNVQQHGEQYQAQCPAHDDKNASLSITEKNGKVLFYCHAGCDFRKVMDAIGIQKPEQKDKPVISKICDYCNADGSLNFQVVRTIPKGFKQRKNADVWKMDGVQKTLYKLPELIAANKTKLIFLSEGEKDVETLFENGFLATCNAGGAVSSPDDKKWLPSYTETLTGCNLCIVADKDEPGRKHAAAVAEIMQGKAGTIRVIECPDVNGQKVKDVTDYFNAGGTVEELKEIVRKTPILKYEPAIIPEIVGDDEQDAGTGETDKIKSRFFEILNDATIKDKAATMAGVVTDYLLKRGNLYFHEKLKTFESSMYFDLKRHVLLKIRSDEFQSWLADYTGINRADPKFKYIISAIETASLSHKLTTGIIPARYWAAKSGNIYLSNGDGRLIRISAGKYELLDNGTDGVLFEAGYTLKPWKTVEPRNPFDCSLFKNASFADPTGFMLLQLYAFSLPTNPRCKPPLVLTSPVGGGKTRTAVGLCEIFGIPARISKVLKEGESDFWTGVNDGGVLILDNADTKTDWLADALATASTGGQHTKRKLYSDSTIVSLDANAWPIVTSANPTFASDAGLADRTLLIRLQRRSGETADNLLSDEITINRNAGLSFICETISKALSDTMPTPKALNKRHPDFADFAVRLGRAMGKEQESIQALQAAELDKSKFNLENDELGSVILGYMAFNESLSGTTAEILQALKFHDSEFSSDYWTPKRAGKRLAKLEAHLSELFKYQKIYERTNFKITISRRNAVYAVFQEAVLTKPLMREKDLDFTGNSVLNTANTANPKSYPFNNAGKCEICGFVKDNEYSLQCPDCLRKAAV